MTRIFISVFTFLLFCASFTFETRFPTTASANRNGSLAALQSAATITSISPGQTPKDAAPAKIVLKGSGFLAGSTVLFNTTIVPANVKTTGRKIIIKNPPASLFIADRTYDVTVKSPGGEVSNTVKFVVGTGSEQNVPASITVVDPQSPVVNTGGTATIRVRVLDKDGLEILNPTLSFTSDSTSIASVTAGGVVTGLQGGAATIRVTAGTVSASVTFAVNTVTTEPSGIFGNSDLEVQGGTGSLFASDFLRHVLKVRRVAQSMTDFTGRNGTPGNADGASGTALFNAPLGIGLGPGTPVYLADTNNQSVRQVDPSSGAVVTVATLSSVQAVAGVSSWGPRDVAVDSNQDLYISDAVNHVVWQATRQGSSVKMKVLAGGLGQAGTQDGTGTGARFNTPQKLTLVGNVLNVTESGTALRQIALPGGAVKSISSNQRPDDPVGLKVGLTDDEPPIPLFDPLQSAQPTAIASDAVGNLYVAVAGGVKILTFADNRTIVTDLAPPGTLTNPVGVAVTDADVFVLESSNGQLVRFRVGQPTVTSVNPSQVAANSAPTVITITGTNFLADTQVYLGTRLLPAVQVNSSTQLQFTLPTQSFGGSLAFTIRNRGGSAQGTVQVTGNPAQPAVSLSGFPTSRDINAGETAVYTIGINRTNFTGSVDLRVQGLPSGASAQFAPTPTTGDQSVLTVTTTGSTAPGTYPLQVSTSTQPAAPPITLTLTIAGPAVTVDLSASPSSQTVAPGQSATFDVSVNRGNFTGSVNLSVSGLPGGANGTFSPNPATSSSQLTITTSSSTPEGQYKLTLGGTASGATVRSVEVTLTVSRSSGPSVDLVVSPSAQSVTAGGRASYTVTLNRTNFTGIVLLNLAFASGSSGTGIAFQYSPASTSGTEATLTVFTNFNGITQPGTYRFVAKGTASGATVNDSAAFTLVVNQGQPPSVTLSINPTSRTITAGQAAQYSVSVSAVNYAGSVNIGVAGNIPQNTTVTFNPSGCNVPCTSTLSFATSPSVEDGQGRTGTPAGTYTMQLTGTASGVTISPVTFTLIVQPAAPPSVTLSMSPTFRSVLGGQSANYTVNVNGSNLPSGFGLTISVSGTIPAGVGFSFNPSSFPIPGTTTLIATTSGSTPPGTYNFQLTGTSTNPSLSITPVPFQLQVATVGRETENR